MPEAILNSLPARDARPRLLLFTDSFVHGGTERQLVTALRHLDRARFDVAVGCLKRRGPFLAEVEALGIPIVEFPIRSLFGVDTARWFLRLVRFLRENKVDILHAFDYYTDIFAVPAARWAGVRVVMASRRNLAHGRGLIERLALRAACQCAHAVVANSSAAAHSNTGLFRRADERVVVIPNAIELPPAGLPSRRAELTWPGDAIIVGVVAALRPEKGHRTFLRAAALAARGNARLRFLLIGDGAERATLQSLAADLGIAERVHFAGDQTDVPNWIAAMDIAVLPSDFESLPNAVLEAMAAGKPVVATRVGGTPDVVAEGRTGHLVDVGDAAAMAQRIEELAASPGARAALGAAGRSEVERRFLPRVVVPRLEQLYTNHLLRRGATARILQIGNYPPPVCGWAIHSEVLDRELRTRGVDARVMDIGPGRTITGRDCVSVQGSLDYAWKLLRYRARGFTFHMHVNGDSWKGYLLALAAVLLGRLTGKPAALTFHAGPVQLYFPRRHGLWHSAFKLLFRACGQIICNHEPVRKLIVATYGVRAEIVHPIPAFSTQYHEEIPVPLVAPVEQFLQAHAPRLFSYSLFRPEFTMDALFTAFAAVRVRYPNAGLLIAGPKETPPATLAEMQRCGIAQAVLIPGNLEHAEFLTAVERCDVFVRTHLRDGVCTSVLEALSLGVPVVAAEDGLRPPSVVKFAPGDADDLAAKLLQVLGNLAAARAAVQRPDVTDHLGEEIAVLLQTAPAPVLKPSGSEARG
jgi:glycosyltransferase involved in cell wall biosynthesis